MPLTPSGLISDPLVRLARLIASSAAFRTLTGSATEALALNFVHYHEADDTASGAEAPRPRAIISHAPSWRMSREGPGTWFDSGDLNFSLELTIPSAQRGDLKEEAVYFDNNLGAILLEMRNNSGGANVSLEPYLNAIRFEFRADPAPCDLGEEHEYFWGCDLLVEWN